MIAVVPRVLGSLFSCSPESEQAQIALNDLPSLDQHFNWQQPEKIAEICSQLPKPDAERFAVLFEGIGAMPAPPWGSVYQDPERIVMGESTLAWRRFLQINGLTPSGSQSEPDDQFGLMLLALAHFLEQENDLAAVELLEQHLLPWAPAYLSRLENACTQNSFYYSLARIAGLFLDDLTTHLSLTPRSCTIFS